MSEKENEAEALAVRLMAYRSRNEWGGFVQHDICAQAASLLRSQAERIAELEGVLTPISAIMTMKPWPDYKHIPGMTVGLVRAARTALRGEKEKASFEECYANPPEPSSSSAP